MRHRAPSANEERTETQPEPANENVVKDCATTFVTDLLGNLVQDIERDGLTDIEPGQDADFLVESPPIVFGPSDCITEKDDDENAQAWIADLAPIQESSQPDEEEESRCEQLEAFAGAVPTLGIHVVKPEDMSEFDRDPYDGEDVVSLASADSWDEASAELEADNFVSMAMKFARASVIAGLEAEDDEEKRLDHGSEQLTTDAAETFTDTGNLCQLLIPTASETCTKPSFQELLCPSNESSPVQSNFSPANFSQLPDITVDIAALREWAESASAPESAAQEGIVAMETDSVQPAPEIDCSHQAEPDEGIDAMEPDSVQPALEIDCSHQEEPVEAASAQSWRLSKRPATPAVTRSSPCSSRSKRLVFGAVVRGPATNEDTIPTSPRPSCQTPTRNGKRNKKPAVSFSMDFDDDSAPECNGKQAARESSLTRSYDALGVELYSMHDLDETVPAPWTKCPETATTPGLDAFITRPSSTRSYHKVQESRPALGLGRSQKPRLDSSGARSFELGPLRPKSSGRACSAGRNTSMPSAMSLDLGFEAPRSAGSTSKDSRLLPSLSKSTSAGSIAWSVYMAKTAGKRADRGGRIAVF